MNARRNTDIVYDVNPTIQRRNTFLRHRLKMCFVLGSEEIQMFNSILSSN